MAVWSREENKIFENALVKFPEEEPDRWLKIAGCFRGKTMYDVMMHYDALSRDVTDIEQGLIQLPAYSDFPITDAGSKSRKKGKPWTEEEHQLFLIGLKKYGRSDWRSISRNVVKTRLPSQVASHAQKYFIRQEQQDKKKRKRSSIHDAKTHVTPPAKLMSDPDSPHTPRNNHVSPLPYSHPSTNLLQSPGMSSKQPPYVYTPNPVNVAMSSNLYLPTAQSSSPYTLTDVMNVSMANNLYDPSHEQSPFNPSNVNSVSNIPSNAADMVMSNPYLLMEQSSYITPSNMHPATEQSPYAISNTYTSTEQSPSSTDSLAFGDINSTIDANEILALPEKDCVVLASPTSTKSFEELQ